MDIINKIGLKKLIVVAILVLSLIFFLFCPILSFVNGGSFNGDLEYEGYGLFELMDKEGPTGVVIFYTIISALMVAASIVTVLLDKPRKTILFATVAWCLLTLITTMIFGSGWDEAIDLGWGLWVAEILVIGSVAAEVVLPEEMKL